MKITTRNVNRLYLDATFREERAGRAWYMKAYFECEDIAKQHDIPVHIVAGVVAALSPNNKWARNMADADRVIQMYKAGAPAASVKVCTYGANRDKAFFILAECVTPQDVRKVLNGRKTVSFFNCIMGEDDVCIDGHARNIVYNKRVGLSDGITIGKREYSQLQDVYRRAAKQISKQLELRYELTAYQVQAVTWTVWRRQHGIA